MTKIMMFSTRQEEVQVAEAWAIKNNVDLTMTQEKLTQDNVHLLRGFDGVSTSQTSIIDQAVYPALKELGIKQIAQRSAGYDMFDLKLAEENQLILSNVPSYSPNSIAEFAVTTALQLVRNTAQIEKNVQNYDFRWSPAIMSRSIRHMTVAVIGTGRIGKFTARIFNGFGSKVVAYDPIQNAELTSFVEYKETLEDAVHDADIVLLHIPLNDDNYHLFNQALFSRFKKGALFINAARGGIVDTKALITAIDSGQLAGAAVDTYENEEPYFKKNYSGSKLDDATLKTLIDHDRIILTPHIAFFTDVAVQNLVEGGLDATLQVIQTGSCDNRVN